MQKRMKFLEHKRLLHGIGPESHCGLSVSENLEEGLKRKPERRNETVAGKKERQI
jgi:hypothetical protein